MLVSITPSQRADGDYTISATQLQLALSQLNLLEETKAIIIRTLPNDNSKLTRNYSGQNPVYLEADAAGWLAQMGFEHLLIDLPSVDREEDGGALSAHHQWWNYPSNPRYHATITELIYIPSHLQDGHYLLNIQTASLTTDASPSKPCLYVLRLMTQ